MKYIDADKLIALIDAKLEDLGLSGSVWVGRSVLQDLKNDIITSLQQEQLVNKDLGTLIACDIIEMTAKKAIDKPQDKEKEEELMTRKINYLRLLEENYVQQEQPEADLEKEINFCWMNWLSPSNQKAVEGVLPKT